MKRSLRTLVLAFLVALGALAGCSNNDGPPPRNWPPEFRSFAFSRDAIVLFPGTCEFNGFTMETIPAYGLDDIEIEITDGPTRIEETSRQVSGNQVSIGYRVCTRDDHDGTHDEGRIKVSFKERPDYYVEARFPRRQNIGPLETDAPLLVIPVTTLITRDLVFSEDERSVEVATVDGTVARWSLETLTLERARFGELHTAAIVDERRVIHIEPVFGRAHLVDTQSRAHLTTWADRTMQQWKNPGIVTLAHARSGLVALSGESSSELRCFVSALDTRSGHFAEILVGEIFGNYAEARRLARFDHLVVSPDGRTVASRIAGCIPSAGAMESLYDTLTDRNCEFLPTGRREVHMPIAPAFSSDSEWFLDQGLNVYNVPACSRRSAGLAPTMVPGASTSAISRGGHRVAVSEPTRIRLFTVPPEFGSTIAFEKDIEPFSNAKLRFSDDGERLFAVRPDRIRIYDLASGDYVESRALNSHGAAIYGNHLHVPSLGGRGHLVYSLGVTAQLAAILPDDSEFLGIDDFARVFYALDGVYYELSLANGETTEFAGAPDVAVAPPSAAYSLYADDVVIVVERR